MVQNPTLVPPDYDVVNAVAVSTTKPASLFGKLSSNSRPIATKSRRFSNKDQLFTSCGNNAPQQLPLARSSVGCNKQTIEEKKTLRRLLTNYKLIYTVRRLSNHRE